MSTSKKVRILVVVLAFLFFTPLVIYLGIEELIQYHRQKVYQKVIMELVAAGGERDLYQAIRGQAEDYEIIMAVESFFEEMTRQVSGQEVRVVIPKRIRPDDIEHIDALLENMRIIGGMKFFVQELAKKAKSNPEVKAYLLSVILLYEEMLQAYAEKEYAKDKQAIEILSRSSLTGGLKPFKVASQPLFI